MTQLVITSGFVVRQLQPVERRRGSQGDAFLMQPIQAQRLALLTSHRQERIQTQPIMVIKILVTQRQSVKPLPDQLLKGVIGITQIAAIVKTGCQRSGDSQALIKLSQQQGTPSLESVPPEKSATTFREPKS